MRGDCGNICYVSTSQLTTGETVSCGCKNDENRANLPNLDRGLIDGTMKCGIKADRKFNRNNKSGARGVHFDKVRGLWVAQMMFQHKAYLLGRFKHKRDAIKARKVGEEKYFGKYRGEVEMEDTTNFTNELIKAFESLKKEISNNKNSRYLSWEHCYKEFEGAFSKIGSLKDEDYLNLSLHLAFYLASWGMYRGSSFLLQFDYKIHIEVVKLILQEEYKPLLGYYWGKDAEKDPQNLDLLFGDKRLVESIKGKYVPFRGKVEKNGETEQDIGKVEKNGETEQDISDILVTKILLGTLGCVPAYDRMLKRALKSGKESLKPGKESGISFIQTFGKKSFENLVKFYSSQESILEHKRKGMTFEDSSKEYPQMKFLDMSLWQLGLEKLKEEKEDIDGGER